MRKIIVFPGIRPEYLETLAKRIKKMPKDDALLLTHDVKIYDIDNCYALTNIEIEEYLKKHGIKME